MNSLDSSTLFTFGLICFGAIIAGGAVCMLMLVWVAGGEPDANGDPERDAGFNDDEIAELSQSWDRGSEETVTHPNLAHARRLNRAALRRAAGLTQ